MKCSAICAIFVVLAFCTNRQIDAYRILAIFPFNGPSHMIMFQELVKTLADKGHKIDLVSEIHSKTPHPNITEIEFDSGLLKLQNNFSFEQVRTLLPSVVDFIGNVAGNLLCEKLGSKPIQDIVKNPPSDPPYDVFITEVFGAHCYMAIGHMLNVPVIGVSTANLYPWLHQLVGAPENIPWFLNTVIDEYVEEMNFWWRLYNTVYTAYNVVRFNYITAKQDEIIRRHLGPKAPNYQTIVSEVALILNNNHMTMSGVRDTTAALVDVGGMHISENGPELPEDVKKWVDESDGFIYFTFGSMVKIESLPNKTLSVIYKSLQKIAPVRVLMKVAVPEELMPGLPDNILTAKWLTQSSVLKHPKIRAFITHGGLLGTQEAIYFGVPMIGMPIFADQFRNVHMSAAKNISIYLDIDNLTEKDMVAALRKVLTNPIYRESIKRESKLFRDRPLNPKDTAIYWIEYIVKHGSRSLRSPSMELRWYQVALLDVYLFLLISGLLAVFALVIIGRMILNALSRDDDISKKNR